MDDWSTVPGLTCDKTYHDYHLRPTLTEKRVLSRLGLCVRPET